MSGLRGGDVSGSGRVAADEELAERVHAWLKTGVNQALAQRGHLRVVQSSGKPNDYDPANDPAHKPLHPTRLRPDGVWDRGGQNYFSSPVHKSATVDYGILLAGERTLLLDRSKIVMQAGDVVVQLGNWHGWTNLNGGSLMAFVMMGATFDSEPKV